MVTPPNDPDRPRGILSRADREYLLASDEEREENYSRSGRTQRERAIRERTVNAIMDFSLLQNLPADELQQIYEDLTGWRDALVFLFRPQIRGILDSPSGVEKIRTPHDVRTFESNRALNIFESNLKRPIESALAAEGASRFTVGVDVKIEPRDLSTIDTAINEVTAGAEFGDLDEDELRAYMKFARHAGAFDFNAVAEERRQQRDEAAKNVQEAVQSDSFDEQDSDTDDE